MRFFSLLFLVSFLLPISAQESPRSKTEETNKLILKRIPEEISIFKEYLHEIRNRNLTVVQRYRYVDLALGLFVGNGMDYKEYLLDEEGNVSDTIVRKGVMVEFTSLRSNKIMRRPLRTYLKGLADMRYGPITIETIKYHVYDICDSCNSIEGSDSECVVQKETIYTYGTDTISPTIIEKKKIIPCGRTGILYTDDGVDYLPVLGDVAATQLSRM